VRVFLQGEAGEKGELAGAIEFCTAHQDLRTILNYPTMKEQRRQFAATTLAVNYFAQKRCIFHYLLTQNI